MKLEHDGFDKNAAGLLVPKAPQILRGRRLTHDVAYTYRMDGGIAGSVNRTHPVSIEQNLNDATNPLAAFGLACMITNTGTVRQMAIGDNTGTDVYGFAVRPFPFQQSSASNYGTASLGGATPPAGIIDIMRSGYMTVLGDKSKTYVKGQPVYIWCAASSGNNIQGGVTNAASAGNTMALTNCFFVGGADANGNVEIVKNP